VEVSYRSINSFMTLLVDQSIIHGDCKKSL